MPSAIEIKGLTFNYNKKNLLKNINLNINEGEFYSIIGPNGAGKTTLLRLILGLIKVSKGTIKVFGQEVNKNNIFKIRRVIGYVPQYVSIDKKFPTTVKEVISIGRISLKNTFERWMKEDENIINYVMKMLNIENLSTRLIGELSGGELQKVLIALSLSKKPKILLLDEPTSNLDPKSQNEILDIIESIYSVKNITTIFVTHLLSHIPLSCRKIALLKEAEIFYDGFIEDSIGLLPKLYDYPVDINIIKGKIHIHVGKEKIHL